MAISLIACVIVIMCNSANEICGLSQAHFPLKNCSGDELDILGLVEFDQPIWPEYAASLRVFYSHIVGQDNISANSRVHVAIVLDRSTTHSTSTDIRGWTFKALDNIKVEYLDSTTNALQYRVKNIQKVVELKMQYVERLFREMSGVRDTALHVGIIFLDGAYLTQGDIRRVPAFVQQQNSDIKILFVIVGNKIPMEIVQLCDTIVLPNVGYERIEQILLMAVCRKCLQGWVSNVELTSNRHGYSCYRFNIHDEPMTWTNSMKMCNTLHTGFLATIETVDELSFVRMLLYKMIKEFVTSNNSHTFKAQVAIGLHRDVSSYAKRFHWYIHSKLYLPLAVLHWLPGRPSSGFGTFDCGIWVFKGNWTHDHYVNMTDGFNEGWTNVVCNDQLIQMSLCEVVLREGDGTNNVLSVKVASNESFNAALSKGDFLSFQDNIVSVYENVDNKDVLRSFREFANDCPMFDCAEDTGQQRFIPFSLVCDYVDHCSNRQDEMYCFHPDMYFSSVVHCASGLRCWDGSCLPIQWLNDGEADCQIYTNSTTKTVITDEDSIHELLLKNYKTCALICNSDTCISSHQLDDGVNDCIGPDGNLDETIGKLEAINSCTSSFSWAPKCVYVKDMYDGTIGCRDMSHLRDCGEFECAQGYVKCYNSYCVPQHYLLDGKADCPAGEDEQAFNVGPCRGNFACWNSNICLHPDLVCDGRSDCPHKDDELNCNTLCPEGFRCTAGAVLVLNHSLATPIDLYSLDNIDSRTRYLDLSGIDLSQIKDFFYQTKIRFVYVVVLVLSNCNISNIHMSDNETLMEHTAFNIQRLDISYNMIHELFSSELFTVVLPYMRNLNASYNNGLVSMKHLNFSLLEILDLSHTGLSYLSDFVFAGLPGLKHLNLSYTLISDFSRQYFPAALILHTLDLRGLVFDNLEADLFHGVSISQNLYTDHYQICCPKIRGSNIPPHTCHSPTDAISSCFDLIGLFLQRALLWVVAILAVVGNVAVIVYRVIWDRSVLKTGYGLFVTNLGISNFLMGVYLFIIAGADYFYRDNYAIYDKSWRESSVCKFAGLTATLSHETSTCFTFLITLDRFLIMKFPFGQNHFSRIPKIVTILLVWVTGLLLSLIPLLLNFNIYTSNAMCLGLPFTNTGATGWTYSVGVFIIFKFVMFLFIAYGQYAIFHAMSQNRISKTATSMPCSRRAEDITVAKQLSLVVLSEFLCWFPIGLMGLMSLSGIPISNEVYAWTTVLLLPINSAVNPVLYTIPALIASWKKFKLGKQIL